MTVMKVPKELQTVSLQTFCGSPMTNKNRGNLESTRKQIKSFMIKSLSLMSTFKNVQSRKQRKQFTFLSHKVV